MTPTTELLDAIATAKTRAGVVKPYHDAILLDNGGVIYDWPEINAAIVEKWSKAGLIWIKKQAWR